MNYMNYKIKEYMYGIFTGVYACGVYFFNSKDVICVTFVM